LLISAKISQTITFTQPGEYNTVIWPGDKLLEGVIYGNCLDALVQATVVRVDIEKSNEYKKMPLT
jgi:hypothetical protein